MKDNTRDIAGFILLCSAFWSVMLGAATHSIGWFAIAAICTVLSVIAGMDK